MQREVTDATDQCSLEVERVISTMIGDDEEDKTKKGEREKEEEEIDERLRNVLERLVSKLRQKMAKVVERERAQRRNFYVCGGAIWTFSERIKERSAILKPF